MVKIEFEELTHENLHLAIQINRSDIPEDLKKEPFYRLMGFVIDQSFRSKGLGGIILEKAIDQIYEEFGKRPIALGC